MENNKQDSNVGNLGDIIKHAALIRLLEIMIERGHTSVINYLDTHAYLAYAKCGNADWTNDITGLMKMNSGYRCYYDLEAEHVNRGSYVCSVGIALEKLAAKKSRLFIAEKDPETRIKLREQLQMAGVIPDLFLNNMDQFKLIDQPVERGPVLALFDPFFESDDEYLSMWQMASSFVDKIYEPSCVGMVLAFQYRKDEQLVWGEPPKGLAGPVASICVPKKSGGAFYHLSAYVSPSVEQEATMALSELGWLPETKEKYEQATDLYRV